MSAQGIQHPGIRECPVHACASLCPSFYCGGIEVQ
jgi:hypothetical protein